MLPRATGHQDQQKLPDETLINPWRSDYVVLWKIGFSASNDAVPTFRRHHRQLYSEARTCSTYSAVFQLAQLKLEEVQGRVLLAGFMHQAELEASNFTSSNKKHQGHCCGTKRVPIPAFTCQIHPAGVHPWRVFNTRAGQSSLAGADREAFQANDQYTVAELQEHCDPTFCSQFQH